MRTIQRAWSVLWQGRQPTAREIVHGAIELLCWIVMLRLLAVFALGLTP